jgi:hypothetical protein
MMDDIIEPTMEYNFSDIYLGPPSTVPGGSYFTRIMYKNNKPLYVQTPKCFTKQGFVKNGKKIYADLMFDNNDTVFINWIENLESKCQDLIFVKGESWFQTKLEKNDIETAFTSPFKIYKSGKFYLLRVNVKPNIKMYGETDNVMSLDDVLNDKPLISIIEIQGIKFTSRSFQLEIELKQSMVVSPDPFLDSCFIKRKHVAEKPVPSLEKINEPVVLETAATTATSVLTTVDKPIIDLNMVTSANTKTTDTNATTNAATTNVAFELEEFTDFTFDDEDEISKPEEKEPEETKPQEKENENITLEIEDLNLQVHVIQEKDDPNILKELDLSDSLENLESITLKKPNQVYYEIYQKAREKAKKAKQEAILAYLEVKNIKKTYMLDDINESDDEFSIDDVSETF